MGVSHRLSAAVICLNEEDKIADCLDSLSFCDEIVVVDSGSTDATVEIAKAKGAIVVHNDWPGHIEQKNVAVDRTGGEWVLSLDADERVSPALRDEILAVLDRPEADAYAMPRIVWYLNRWIRHGGWYPARKVRLFRREKGRWGGENPHDRVFVDGKVGNLDGDVYHLSFDDVAEHLRTLNAFTDIAARERVAQGKGASLVDILLRPPVTFLKMYVLKAGFLDGVAGLVVAGLSAYHVFCKYVKIREER
jgi:glycosyltransferase involved in cell wall biosynthesis